MPFCRKCGEEISDHQFKNFNRMCPNCIRLDKEYQTQKIATQKTKAKLRDRRFLIILGIVLLGITGLGTAIVMGVHYWYITSFIDSDLKFGAFFIANFIPDVIIGFFVGLAIVIVIVIVVTILAST